MRHNMIRLCFTRLAEPRPFGGKATIHRDATPRVSSDSVSQWCETSVAKNCPGDATVTLKDSFDPRRLRAACSFLHVTFLGNVCLGMQGEICHLHWAMHFLTIKHHKAPSRNRARQCCLRLQFTQSADCCAMRRGGHVSLHRRLWCPTSSCCMKSEAWAYHGGVRAPQVNTPAELDNRVPLPSQIREKTFREIPRHKRATYHAQGGGGPQRLIMPDVVQQTVAQKALR